jgi:protein O-mannosyl-transferase
VSRLGIAAVGAATILAVVVIYRGAVASDFFNDDFHWLAQTQHFDLANLVRLDRYDHFYRPVIELYFAAGLRAFGCEALPFHITSVVVHLLCVAVLFLLARSLSGHAWFAATAAVLFAVQPGYTEAVAWVGAITDLLPGLWFLLALWLHLLFLRDRRVSVYLVLLVVFALCLLTHESSATLLPMMVLLELTVGTAGTLATRLRTVAVHVLSYVPFAAMLLGYLAIAYVVNSRSYLVQEGHYAFGLHAIPNAFNYVVALYVGKRIAVSYVLIAATVGLLLWRGTPRVRLFTLWIFVTLAPVSFFTWGNASRYLYVPAAGFALLLATLIMQIHALAAKRVSARAAQAIVVVLTAALAVRFGLFAKDGADSFRQRTLPYERLASIVRAQADAAGRSGAVEVAADDLYGVPDIYRDAAASIALCRPDVRVTVR